MAANMRLSTTLRNNIAYLISTLIDAGGGAGTIQIRNGTQPASAQDAATGVLLATLTFAGPSHFSTGNGIETFAAITEDSAADASGTATWARILNGAGNTVFDCDVNTSGATINLNTTAIVIGGPVRITAFTVTVPAG